MGRVSQWAVWQYFKANVLARLQFKRSGDCNRLIPKLLRRLENVFSEKQKAAVKTDQKV